MMGVKKRRREDLVQRDSDDEEEEDLSLLVQALTHASYVNEHGGSDNERLEFLGDAVVGHAVSALLYQQFPELSEGELTRRRAALVSEEALAEVRECGGGG